jgi:hypothetical protein
MRSAFFTKIHITLVGIPRKCEFALARLGVASCFVRAQSSDLDFDLEVRASDRQRSEQNRTSFQTFSHFLRHAKGRPHCAQGLLTRSPFFTIFAMA